MIRSLTNACWLFCLFLVAGETDLRAQNPPYDSFPPAEPPYFRVRYKASQKPGELIFGVNYTIWIPKDVKTLRGVIVHQHGCGEGSCKSGLTGAYDLHWQALAKKHDCALLSPSYEQPEKADCQMWCDPRNGSDAAFQKGLLDLGVQSGHPELARVPWALWGHSGGGHWAGAMVLLHPDRVVAAWLRSGVPLLKPNPERGAIKAHSLSDAALKVPIMCNLGTKEGVTVKGDRFAGVWPANEVFFNQLRGKGGLIGVAVDPLTSHECGNQRYLAIPWLDACLTARLPNSQGSPLQAMPTATAWLAPVLGGEAAPAASYAGDAHTAAWLPNEKIAKAWMEYVKDTKVTDTTPPPAPTNVRLQGNKLTWEVEADLESGLARFLIERDGQFLANLPEQGKNPFGRPIFQNLQYSDTPTQPLIRMQFTDSNAEPGKKHNYRVIAVNTVGLKSKSSAQATAKGDSKLADVKVRPNVRFPLQVSNNRRYLVDQDEQPFLVVGDSPWSLIVDPKDSDIKMYLDDRRKRGFNSILVNLIEHKFAAHAPRMHAGLEPFLKAGDFATPNLKYFDFAHEVIEWANERGICVWLCAAYLGWNGGDEGFFREIKAGGPDKLTTYGKFLGERFKNLPNIVWVLGGDFAVPKEHQWTINDLAAAIRAGGAKQPMTIHGGQQSAVDVVGDQDWIDINTTYSYETEIFRVFRKDYARKKGRPFVLIEAIYENEHDSKPEQIRRQGYWAMTCGACGQFFGNNPIWHFDGPGLFSAPRGWRAELDGTGSRDMAYLQTAFIQRTWHLLVPDVKNALVVQGVGKGVETITAAVAPDGKLAIIYVPSTGRDGRDFTVDMGRFAAPVTSSWFNPTNGQSKPLGKKPLANQGTHRFRTPGDNGTKANDWLLVLEVN